MKIAFLSALFMLMPASEALGYWRGPAWGCRHRCSPPPVAAVPMVPVIQTIPVQYQWVLVSNRNGRRFRWRLIGVPQAGNAPLQAAPVVPLAAPPAPSL